MEAADGEASAPPELRLAWECERFHCLPEEGGYMDQDYSMMLKMATLANVYGVYSRFRNAQGAQIHQLGSADRRILRWLKDMGLIFKG